jgi:hypothetical protein
VTIAKRPSVVGRDGERYAGDLGPTAIIISDFPKLFIAAERPVARGRPKNDVSLGSHNPIALPTQPAARASR